MAGQLAVTAGRRVQARAFDDKRRASDEALARPPPKRRRRIVISCTECHRRKQKCDRNQPCTNCVSRNKQDDCRYATGAPTAKEEEHKAGSNGNGAQGNDGEEDSLPTKAVDFGYSQTGASTLGFLKQIDDANSGEPISRLAGGPPEQNDHFGTRERYRSLIRQLPAKTYIDQLVDIFFQDFNWYYGALDRDVLAKQTAEWNNLPFNLLTTQGPHGLAPDLRAFPALLFQILANALLSLPAGPHPTFDSLKYAGNMTFEDLAMDYSESGMAILSLLGKRHMSLTTVQAGFVRAAFLKYTALVTEAWHAIGSAIRDAQEIGMHRDSIDPKPRSNDAEAVLENQWEIQRRRKLWMILVSWDIHTAVVLGRPTTVDVLSTSPTLPVDAPPPKDRSKAPVLPRGEDDPPTPLSRSIWGYNPILFLRKTLELEKEGPCPKDFSRVDRVHQELLEMEERTPPCFRLENPDTRFDSLPECYWLPWARATIPQLWLFSLMALHRPYIFTRAKSRTEALKASLEMLQSQSAFFQTLKPHQYKTFTLFFGTFDAVVLVATIYVLFPKEHPELLQRAIQQFQWSVERFEAMSDRNSLAKAALSVLRAIYIRLKKSLGIGFVCGKAPSSALVDASNIDPSLTAGNANGSTSGASSYAPGPNTLPTSDTSDAYGSISPVADAPAQAAEFSLPEDFDLSNIQPIFATSDLAYNDLMGISAMDGLPSFAPDTADAEGQMPWQFEGGFNDNSVWSLLNQYAPI